MKGRRNIGRTSKATVLNLSLGLASLGLASLRVSTMLKLDPPTAVHLFMGYYYSLHIGTNLIYLCRDISASVPESQDYNLYLIEGSGHSQTDHTELETRKAKEHWVS